MVGLGVPHYYAEGTWPHRVWPPASRNQRKGPRGRVHRVMRAFIPSQCMECGAKERLAISVSFSDGKTHLLLLETKGSPSPGHPVEVPGSTCLQVHTPVAPFPQLSLSLSPHVKMREGF